MEILALFQQVFIEGFLCARTEETLVNHIDIFPWALMEEEKWTVNYRTAGESKRREVQHCMWKPGIRMRQRKQCLHWLRGELAWHFG